ncbi:hypothetical protein D1AOALGA4SA_10697 [Olavius algarvensis Delta 1 endosymbiont]|nr:hypothetical protein D1AOALGA4SA_10697 [Olavius algarvensis Delta 1 endosymbiont]
MPAVKGGYPYLFDIAAATDRVRSLRSPGQKVFSLLPIRISIPDAPLNTPHLTNHFRQPAAKSCLHRMAEETPVLLDGTHGAGAAGADSSRFELSATFSEQRGSN